MGRVFNTPTGDIVVEGSGGETRWSSTFPPVNLLPEASWIDQSLSVAFPDFGKFIAYGHSRWFNPPAPEPGGTWRPSNSGDVCTSLTMIEPGEWVSSAQNIGTVPSGANYIDVRVRLNRTKAPFQFREQVPPALIPNQWVLVLGSCIVEATAIWRRSFDIVLNGQNVQLIRRQSVVDVETVDPPFRWFGSTKEYFGPYGTDWLPPKGSDQQSVSGRDPWGQSSYGGFGWISGGTFAGTYRAGHPAALIEAKPFSANSASHGTPSYGAKHPVRANSCSMDNSAHDFSSTYAGQIVIRPGYIPS